MPFPQSERVIYDKNPISQVVCQLRFPAILKIDSQEPVEFQEEVRTRFPVYREAETNSPIPRDVLKILPSEMRTMMSSASKNHEFLNRDENLKINLTKDFIALTSTNYKRWEEFFGEFESVFQEFLRIYKPAYFTRIGLRYVNTILREDLGLADVAWSELLQPFILGELSEIESAVLERENTVLISLDNIDSVVRIRHGIGKNRQDPDLKQVGYVLDSDFYTEQKIEVENGLTILRTFNRRNRNLFRWCITDKLHEAMVPSNME